VAGFVEDQKQIAKPEANKPTLPDPERTTTCLLGKRISAVTGGCLLLVCKQVKAALRRTPGALDRVIVARDDCLLRRQQPALPPAAPAASGWLALRQPSCQQAQPLSKAADDAEQVRYSVCRCVCFKVVMKLQCAGFGDCIIHVRRRRSQQAQKPLDTYAAIWYL
jgi:hypothetical protein